jgi:YVTN family beta-propeller protein
MSELSLPSYLLTDIDSPIRETRLTGVDELTRLVYGADLATAAAARRALERLARDDSRSVAAAAAAALERTAVRLNPDRIDFGQVPQGTPHLIADVLVEGPPLAADARSTVAVSGPGLRATLAGRRLRIVWQPRSEWLDGLVTIRGPAGWADVGVTGQVVAAGPMSRDVVDDGLWAFENDGMARMTVLPPRPERRRVGGVVLIGGLTALVVLGGVGVGVAVMTGRSDDPPAAVLAGPPSPTVTPTPPATASPSARAVPDPPAISRVPVARRLVSVAKPAVVDTIRVDVEPEGVTVSPDGRTVYVANQGSRVLSVVDTATKRVTSVRLRNTPRFVATSRDGRLVFVSMYDDDKSGSAVAVVDAADYQVLRYLSTGVQPFALAVAPDGRVWVPIHSRRTVEIYTVDGRRSAGKVWVPPNPHAVAFSADLQLAFTANHESNAVAIIDTRTDQLLRSIPVSRAPHSVAVSPDGRTVLVAGYEADTVDLLDAVTLQRTGPFPVGREPQSVAFAADGEHAYVVNEGDDTVSVLNGHTGAVTATVRVGGSPRTVAVSPDGGLAYVSNGDDNTISVLRVGR